MSGLELNKIAAAVLVAGLVGMVVGKTSSILYNPQTELETRGYSIAVAEGAGTGAAEKKEEGPVQIAAFLADASAEKGQSLIKPCATGHSFEQGGPDKVGPNLWAVLGSKHAHKEGYSFSKALAAMHDKTWDFQALSEFLEKPAKYVPGTKMAYAGMKKPEDRAAVLLYLNSLGSNLPLPPPPAEAPAEAPADAPVAQ